MRRINYSKLIFTRKYLIIPDVPKRTRPATYRFGGFVQITPLQFAYVQEQPIISNSYLRQSRSKVENNSHFFPRTNLRVVVLPVFVPLVLVDVVTTISIPIGVKFNFSALTA